MKEVVNCLANTWHVWFELDNLVLEYIFLSSSKKLVMELQ